jgi:hypothetical protein
LITPTPPLNLNPECPTENTAIPFQVEMEGCRGIRREGNDVLDKLRGLNE